MKINSPLCIQFQNNSNKKTRGHQSSHVGAVCMYVRMYLHIYVPYICTYVCMYLRLDILDMVFLMPSILVCQQSILLQNSIFFLLSANLSLFTSCHYCLSYNIKQFWKNVFGFPFILCFFKIVMNSYVAKPSVNES